MNLGTRQHTLYGVDTQLQKPVIPIIIHQLLNQSCSFFLLSNEKRFMDLIFIT